MERTTSFTNANGGRDAPHVSFDARRHDGSVGRVHVGRRGARGSVLENWQSISYFQAMIDRSMAGLLQRRLAQFPAVTLVGPRQCGKTTLARTLARRYFNLESPEERTRLDARWEEVVSGEGPVVFDEAQHWPEVFRRLPGAIDEQRKRNARPVRSTPVQVIVDARGSCAARLSGVARKSDILIRWGARSFSSSRATRRTATPMR
jgi:hypothetical protein